MKKRIQFGATVSSIQLVLLFGFAAQTNAQFLEAELRRLSPSDLAAEAVRDGDAARGAIVFFQPSMVCAKCHAVEESNATGLGPMLTGLKEPLSNAGIVESILEPSKSIRKGFETARVITADGNTVTGLLISRDGKQTALRDASGKTTAILAADIEQFAVQPLSLMPAGQLNQLTSRQQVLDLIRYLIEIRDGGAARARELQPSDALLTLKLPEYEAHVDHAGLIHDWNDDSLARGEAIAPGWADPRTGSFADNQRVEGRDQRIYGPLPKKWGAFRGLYHHGSKVILSYTVGSTDVLEMPGLIADAEDTQPAVFLRSFNFGPRVQELILKVSEDYDPAKLIAGIEQMPALESTPPLRLQTESGDLRLHIPAGPLPLKFTLWCQTTDSADSRLVPESAIPATVNLSEMTRGGPARWPFFMI